MDPRRRRLEIIRLRAQDLALETDDQPVPCLEIHNAMRVAAGGWRDRSSPLAPLLGQRGRW